MASTGTSVRDAQLRAHWQRDGYTVTRGSNGPRAVYAAHEYPYRQWLFVVEGSIAFVVAGAVVGPEGVVCLEAHIS